MELKSEGTENGAYGRGGCIGKSVEDLQTPLFPLNNVGTVQNAQMFRSCVEG